MAAVGAAGFGLGARSASGRRGWLSWLLALAATAAALAVRAAFNDWLGPSLPFITVFAAIAFAAWHGGPGPALLAAASGFVGAAWLSLGPDWLLGPWSRPQFAASTAYTVSCAVLIGLVEALRRAQQRLQLQRSGLEHELSERDIADQALRAQRELLATTLASITDGVIATDGAGRIASLNPAAEALTGWRESAALGLPLDSVCRSVEAGGAGSLGPAAALRQALAGNAPVGPFDGSELVARDGTRRPVEHSAAPLRAGHGGGAVLVLRDVAARRRAEQELRRAHDTLDAIVRSSPLPLVVVDVDPPLVRVWNPAAERLFGWSAQEVIGRPVPVLAPGQEEEGRQLRRRVSQAQGAVELEAQRRCADGSVLAVRIAAMPLADEAGAVGSVLLLYSDITARRRAEAALVRSEATLRAFYDNTPVGMGVVELTDDDDILHLYDNPVTCRLFGLAPGGTANRLTSSLGTAPATSALWVQHYRASERSGRPTSFEFELGTAAGRRWFAATVAPTRPGPAGRMRFCYVVEDVTERREAHGRLARSEAAQRHLSEQLRVITDSLPALVSYVDADGRYRLNNRAYEQWFGHRREELVGRRVRDVLGEAAWAVVEPRMAAALRGETVHYEAELTYRDAGKRWVHAAYIPHRGDGGRVLGFVVLVNDIGERKRAERSKDEFLATLAHELRNPLAPVRNGVHLLRRIAAGLPAAERPLALMERQLAHMVRLVDDLLDVSRVGSAKIELQRARLALAGAVRQAFEISQPLIEAAGHHLALELPDEALAVDADPTRLAQVIANLLNNAAKYTPPGGHLAVRARAEGGEAVVEVQDDGMGIAPELLPHVFEMFTQGGGSLGRAQGGLGIGLAIARRLTELHGGRLEAESAGSGRGSRFVLRLPLAAAAVPPSEAQAAAPAAPDTGLAQADVPAPCSDAVAAHGAPPAGKRVLIADDNADAADSLGEIVALLGHETRIARDGLEAVRLAEAFRPELALLDLGMPGLNGYEVARHLRAQDWAASLVLIAVTGWGQQEDRRRSSEAGFDCHVVKPVEPGRLDGLLATRRRAGEAGAAEGGG